MKRISSSRQTQSKTEFWEREMFLIRLRRTAAKLMKESSSKNMKENCLAGKPKVWERDRERHTHTHIHTCTHSDIPSWIQIDNMCTRITRACNIRVHQKSKRANTHRLSKKSLKRYLSKQLECNWKRGATAAEEEKELHVHENFLLGGFEILELVADAFQGHQHRSNTIQYPVEEESTQDQNPISLALEDGFGVTILFRHAASRTFALRQVFVLPVDLQQQEKRKRNDGQ